MVSKNLSYSVKNKTNITCIPNELDTTFSTFLNDPRKQYKLKITMLDVTTSQNILNNEQCKNISCFWCRHRFDTYPIGCPIRYIPSQIKKTLQIQFKKSTSKKIQSEDCDVKDSYIIKENISNTDLIKSSEQPIQNNVFETDGIFCSFNCCLAFIDDNSYNSKYTLSKNLLMNIYYIVNNINVSSITPEFELFKPAPSWRLLKEYGGHLTIDDFRDSFNKIKYSEINIIKNVPRTRTTALIYEEKVYL